MNFAVPVPDRPREMEIRMEAAYFFQQLCQSRYVFLLVLACRVVMGGVKDGDWSVLDAWYSSLTLQMFLACRGIPVLVDFLEADYAKHRFAVFYSDYWLYIEAI